MAFKKMIEFKWVGNESIDKPTEYHSDVRMMYRSSGTPQMIAQVELIWGR